MTQDGEGRPTEAAPIELRQGRDAGGRRAGCKRSAMADPFELWRLMWSTAISHGLEQLAEASSGTAALARRCQADAIDLSAFPVFGRVRIELATMLLLEQRERTRAPLC